MSAIGLTGCHRTGKSFLAQKFVERRTDYAFLQTSASGVFRDMGLDPSVKYDFDTRLTVQERILSTFCEQYASMNGKSFITDRTPIDLMAYTLAEVGPDNLTDEMTNRLNSYLKKCIDATNRYFPILVIVQPGIKVVEDELKGSLNGAYMEHIAALVMGITASEVIQATHFFIPRRMLDIEKRVDCVESALKRTIDRHQQKIDSAKEAGQPIVFH